MSQSPLSVLYEDKKENPPSSFIKDPFSLVLIAFLAISPWFYGLTRFKDQLIAEIVIFTVFAGHLAVRWGEKRVKPSKNLIDFWVFLALGAAAFYVPFSTLPYRSLLAFLQLLGVVIFYAMVRHQLRSERDRILALWAVLLIGVFYSAYGLAQYYDFLPKGFWYQPFSLAARYVNGGHFAVWLLFSFFSGLALLVSSERRSVQWSLAIFLAVTLWAFVLTWARAAWVAFALGLVICLFGLRQRRLISRKTWTGLVVFLALSGLLLFVTGGLGKVFDRFQLLWKPVTSVPEHAKALSFYSLAYRLDLWKGAWDAFLAAPEGRGLGVFRTVFPQYQLRTDRFFVDYAHNEFLQVAVDLGIPGLLLLVGFAGVYFRMAFAFLNWQGGSKREQVIAMTSLALFTSLLLVSQVDFPLRIYATSFLFATYLALNASLFDLQQRRPMGEPARRQRKRESGLGSGWIRMAFFLAVAGAALVSGRHLFAELHFQTGKNLESNFEWQRAEQSYRKAVEWSSFYTPYHEALGWLYARKSALALSRNQKQKWLEEAIQAYQRAVRIEPDRAFTRYRLAVLYGLQGNIVRARSEFREAIRLDPKNTFLLLEYGYFALEHSLVKEAVDAFEKYKEFPAEVREGGHAKIPEILRRCAEKTQDYPLLRRVITDDVEGHWSLAHLLAEKGRWDLAEHEYNLALQRATLDPNADTDSLRREMAQWDAKRRSLSSPFP